MSLSTFPSMMDNRLREHGSSRLSAEGMAKALDLQQDLAHLAGVHRNVLRTHPVSPKVQCTLHELTRLVSAAHEVQPDPDRAVFLVKNEPIPTLGH